MRVISGFFDDRIISKGKWPAQSPDLSSPDIFLCGLLKDYVYRKKPFMSDDLKKETETQVHVIDENTRKRVFGNMIKRLDACQAIGGG